MIACILLIALTSLQPAHDQKAVAQKAAAQKIELFAKDDAYCKQAGAEQEFTGTLDGVVLQAGRNYGVVYRLLSTTIATIPVEKEVAVEVNGLLEKRKIIEHVAVATTIIRAIYLPGKAEELRPYNRKQIKLIGKMITVDKGDQTQGAIWPAHLEVLPNQENAVPPPNPNLQKFPPPPIKD